MKLEDAYKAADKGPLEIDNNLMIVAKNGDYVARIDASEGKKWRASAALLVHGFNNLQQMKAALQKFVEHYPMGTNPQLDEAWVQAQFALGHADDVRVIGE